MKTMISAPILAAVLQQSYFRNILAVNDKPIPEEDIEALVKLEKFLNRVGDNKVIVEVLA